MRITIENLKNIHCVDKATIHSADMSRYYLSVLVDGQEYVVTDVNGKLLSAHNKMVLQELLAPLSVQLVVLRHSSAYDEMIGQPVREACNALEVPLVTETRVHQGSSGSERLH